MKFPILATVLVFCLVLSIFIKKSDKEQEHALDEFWEKEKKANFTRKKSLDNLSYISIPESITSIAMTSAEGKDALLTLQQLSTQKIVNFTGITNTDLKLTYGTANINLLSEYDQNYTLMVRTLQKLAVELKKEERLTDMETVLTFSINQNSDIKGSYELLASYYKTEGRTEDIEALLAGAQKLPGLSAPSIVRYLESILKEETSI